MSENEIKVLKMNLLGGMHDYMMNVEFPMEQMRKTLRRLWKYFMNLRESHTCSVHLYTKIISKTFLINLTFRAVSPTALLSSFTE